MIENYMNTKEIADFLGKTQNHATGLCKTGKIIGATKDMGSWYAPKKSVEIYKLIHMKGDTRQRDKGRKHRERVKATASVAGRE